MSYQHALVKTAPRLSLPYTSVSHQNKSLEFSWASHVVKSKKSLGRKKEFLGIGLKQSCITEKLMEHA